MSEPKGRPTPKRSEARKGRVAAAKPPTSRKEAARRQRELTRAKRAESARALKTGDERNYPEFFRGPEKQAVRDAVDSRRSYGWLALPAFLVNLGSFVAPTLQLRSLIALLSMALMALVVADAILTVRRVRAFLRERFPDGTEESRGSLVRYGLARGFQRRSRRMPPPRVAPARAGTTQA